MIVEDDQKGNLVIFKFSFFISWALEWAYWEVALHFKLAKSTKI